ncbi:hypothetical protein UFOVP1205_7 [uncultured Caudovirales phage]|uniref:Uncharacterized protein n=1 Tax=uncultured Caudovirales phage TaxID=2100421 RepID=A0A6J5R0K1_9CAUD|nr:hypothetical protein UFOVP1205_7 [uncultured Caudovirales phage]
MPNANEIRLPITIVADGQKATAQLEKFRGQAGSISSKMRGYFKSEAAGAAGLLTGYFGIQQALNGLKQFYEYSKKVSEIAGTYSGSVAMAQAGVATSQIAADQRTATAVAPTEIQRASEQKKYLDEGTTKIAEYASAFGLQFEHIFAYIGRMTSQTISAYTGDSAGAEKMRTENISSVADILDMYLPEKIEKFLYSFSPDMSDRLNAPPVSAAVTGGIAPDKATGAAMLAELQAMNAAMRAQRGGK